LVLDFTRFVFSPFFLLLRSQIYPFRLSKNKILAAELILELLVLYQEGHDSSPTNFSLIHLLSPDHVLLLLHLSICRSRLSRSNIRHSVVVLCRAVHVVKDLYASSAFLSPWAY